VAEIQSRRFSPVDRLVQFLPEGGTMPNLGGIVRELKTRRDRAQRERSD
jgi:hypothetical protein